MGSVKLCEFQILGGRKGGGGGANKKSLHKVKEFARRARSLGLIKKF